MRTCIGLGGKSYILEDSQFQGGGEASLYQIVDRPNLAAKLYNSRISEDPVQIRERERKLKAMVATNIPAYMDGLLRLAWPMDVLYENGKMVGFVMPKVSCPLNFYDVQRFNRSVPNSLSTKNVLAVWPDFNWKSSLQVAYNLAALVAFLHAKGIVVGDLNQKNILLDGKTRQVVLVDCDSFQFMDPKSEEMFYCDVGMPEILPPELQQKGSFRGKFNRYTDDFSLAVHIFRLMMMNADPFGGIGSQGPSRSAMEWGNQDILEGNCPYVRTCSIQVPPFVPDYTMIPSEIRQLFDRTFNYTAGSAKARISQRATGREWVKALEPYCLPKTSLITHCQKDPKSHVYPFHNPYCPWCALEQRMNLKAGQNTGAGKSRQNQKQTNPSSSTGQKSGFTANNRKTSTSSNSSQTQRTRTAHTVSGSAFSAAAKNASRNQGQNTVASKSAGTASKVSGSGRASGTRSKSVSSSGTAQSSNTQKSSAHHSSVKSSPTSARQNQTAKTRSAASFPGGSSSNRTAKMAGPAQPARSAGSKRPERSTFWMYVLFGLSGLFGFRILQGIDMVSIYYWTQVDFEAHVFFVSICGLIFGLLCARLLEESYQTSEHPVWMLAYMSAGLMILAPLAGAVVLIGLMAIEVLLESIL